MYPSPGHAGCAYTGSTGGATLTDTKTPAKDEAEIARAASAKTKQRTNRVICIILLMYLARQNRAHLGTTCPASREPFGGSAGFINASCRNLLLTKCELILQWVAADIIRGSPRRITSVTGV